MGILRKVEEVWMKNSLYDKKCEWDMHSVNNLVICLDDINGHVGFNGFNGVHGVGQRNFEGRMLLVLSGEGIMYVKYMA